MSLSEELAQQFLARELRGSGDKEKAYRLRYDVFCLERQFLDPSQYPSRLESDDYDGAALHFGIFHRQNHQLVAAARLVSWNGIAFPFQKHCSLNTSDALDTAAGAEISRLVVAHNFRRRINDGNYSAIDNPGPIPEGSERRLQNPVILLGLFRAIYRGSKAHGIETWYAAMEPSLQRHLRRLLIDFEQIGPLADYYGEVAPYRVDIAGLEQRIAVRNPEMFAAFQ